ncbi:MAG TPA: hypothetical protein DC049_15280 [Spirochaetia bacterium]|nr:hypothetical protein [Spirochaetia bacterium]
MKSFPGLFLLFFIFQSSAQTLTLQQIRKIVLKENIDAVIAGNNLAISYNNYLSSLRVFYLPEISISASSPLVYQGTFPLTNQKRRTNHNLLGTLLIEEKLPWNMVISAEINDRFVTYPPTNRTNQYSGKITVKQPVLKNNGSDLRLARDSAEKKYKLDILKLAAGEKELIYQAETLYYDLLSIESEIALAVRRIEKSTVNRNETEKKYQAGLITEITFLRIEQDYQKNLVNELDLLRRQKEKKEALANLLNIRAAENINIEKTIQYEPVIFDYETSLSKTLLNDQSLADLEYKLWQEKRDIHNQLENYRFNADLFMIFEKKYTSDYEIRAGIDVFTPVFKRGNMPRLLENHRLTVNTLSMQLSNKKQTIAQNLERRIKNLSDLEKSIVLARRNNEIAAKTYEIDNQRFEIGLITAETLIKTQEDYFETESRLLAKKIEYLKERSYLENKYWMAKSE